MAKIDLMDCCSECEHITHDQDGEESADCSDGFCKCHEVLRLSERQKAEKELFEMVYEWGRNGIVTDYECNAFQKKLQEVRL